MPGKTGSDVSSIDGQMDFSGGVNSNCVTTIASNLNPNGLARNQVAWMVNATNRNGGIRPRSGWQPKGTVLKTPGLYQGGYVYQPIGSNPGISFLMDGIPYYIADVDNPAPTDLSAGNAALQMPPTQPQAFFRQGEDWLIIQAGDYLNPGPVNPPITDSVGRTLPLFWNGTLLRRSLGIIGPNAIPGQPKPWNEIPGAGPMTYYMDRLWYAQGRFYSAGDVLGGAAGTSLTSTDGILHVTENPLCLGGDGFHLPTDAGNIRWLGYAATPNSQLGQGDLLIGTRKQIYGQRVPVTRIDWIGADANNLPLQYAVCLSTGPVNDRSVAMCNSDLFFQTLQPSVQSLAAAVRNVTQWGNVPVSVNENRLLAFNNRALLWASSGIYFDNRVLQTAIPVQSQWGVLHSAVVPLNFDNISSLNSQLPPAWEGQLSGLDILQLFCGDFGDRAFALVISRADNSLQLWELTIADRRDNGDNRIDWVVEFPAYTHGKEYELKEDLAIELWLDDVEGTIEFTLDYRPDSDSCWYPWYSWKVCAARNSNETLNPTTPYPTLYGPGYKSTITLPHPPQQCNAFTGRPAFINYQCQPRLTIKGWCRVRGVFLHAAGKMRELYAGKVC